MDTRVVQLQRESLRRGFSISHQKVVLEIDFSGGLWGYTEITIVPTSSELRTIHLHSRQCIIHSVTVGGHQADFVHHDPMSNISITSAGEETPDVHKHPELKRKIYSALQESDEGELSIGIPKDVSLKQATLTGGYALRETSTLEPSLPGNPQQQEFNPIVVKIAYSLRNPVDGLEFVLPTDAYPYRVPHAYTTPSSPDSARCWVPCLDNLWERCTWEFEFVVPRYLEEERDLQDDEQSQLTPTVVICSGELSEQVAHPYNPHKTIFLFTQASLTSVQHIAFAAGPFHLHTIAQDNTADDTSQQPLMYAFCLPGHEHLLPMSTANLRAAMSFYSTDFGSYPFTSYKAVFVDELPTQRFDASTLSLLSVDLLHGDDTIEQAIETRHVLSHALACQWVGINILPRSWPDLWLVNGLALFITGLFLKKLFGNNEYRFRMKKDMQRVLEWDNGSMPPVCQPQLVDPPDSSVLPFINMKSPLILHMLDRKLGKSGTSLGLSRVLPKVFLSAISGEMQNNALSTHGFLRTCRKVSGVDLRVFAEQWIYGSGCPSFGFQASFNRKKMAVEIFMRQECPAWAAHAENPMSQVLLKPVQLFEGQMTIRIHEADGTPYEHVLDIRSNFKRYEVPFNTKYKRVRRNTKRYLARQAAAQAAAEGDADAAEAMGMVDMGFGLEIWEKERERENWKVADWTEDDESVMSGATYEWIRMDADFEWIANLHFEQPDFMWVSQLQRDRDVVAQLDAINALAKQPTAIVSSQLTKTVLVSNYHYRIRCEAAAALVQCAVPKVEFLGLFHLFKLFLRYCYDPEDLNQDLFTHTYVPKPNDFSDLSEYFVRKSLIHAISRVRFDANGKSPPIIRRFLSDQLRYNDNTANQYNDGFYICTIISALSCATVPTAAPERGELSQTEVRTELTEEDRELLRQSVEEVERYRSMDRLIPSPHNIVTIAALEFHLVLSVAGLIPSHPKVFFPLTREGNYTPVRIAAFDGIFMTKWYTPQMMRYILAVMANDPSRTVRRHVARNACHSLTLLAQMGEMRTPMKDSESLLIEEDGSHPEKAKEAKKSEVDLMLKVLRKDKEVGKNDGFREFAMPIALAADVDHEVRWCLLKLLDVLVRGAEEAPPTVKIHLPPPVPAAEPTPASPKIPLVPQRSLKASNLAKSPLIPSATPKLKIPLSNPGSRVGTPKTPTISLPALGAEKTLKAPASRQSVPKIRPKGRPPKADAPTKAAPSKSQPSGMGVVDIRASTSVLKKLQSNKHARIFLQPVDPIRDHAPNYFEVIKNPMDLSTMSAKLSAGHYQDRFAFQADFRLMIANAKTYNLPGTYVHDEAIALETFFEKQWSVMNKTIEAKAASSPVKPPPKPSKELPPVPTPTFSPPPLTSTTPRVKLKVKPVQVTPKPAPKIRKIRSPEPPAPTQDAQEDPPPPPYIDDGSADILEEVLAIEREKDEQQRYRTNLQEMEKAHRGASSSKRKREEIQLDDDDDILALAAPLKKDRVAKTSPAKSVRPVVKPVIKPPRERLPEPTPPSILSDTPAPVTSSNGDFSKSSKGKEREAPSPRPASSSRPATPSKAKPAQNVPIDVRKCREALKTLQKLPESALFLRPVDLIADGCPTYFDEIAHPMDFGTIASKLSKGEYRMMADFAHDVELVFSNCRQFNPPGTFPIGNANAVEQVFRREWGKALEAKLSWSEKRGLQGIMTNVMKDPQSWLFREAVDPVALRIPTYFEVIPRENARDLKLIRSKLDNDKYESVEAFEADMALMFDNAITFNGADSEFGGLTQQLRKKFLTLLSSFKSGANKKRKEGDDKPASQPKKKVKLTV